MTMYNFPSGFEDQIQKAMDAPEPNPQKMNALREQFVARGVATLNTNHRETTTPRLRQANAAGRSTPKPSVFARRPAWQWAMLAVLLLAGVAFTSPRVVSAFRALLGFLPGVGVVEQSPSALVLAEPVTIERDGFTLTIDQAVSTAEKTVVVYRYTEPARDNSASQPRAGASSQIVKFPALTLPDGSALGVLETQSQTVEGAGVTTWLRFAPLPAGTEQANLAFTRLNGMPPGEGPEDWTIPLRFTPGNLEEIVLPVADYAEYNEAPASTSGAEPSAQAASPAAQPSLAAVNDGMTLALEKSVELPDGYLLMGSLSWTDPAISPYATMLGVPPVITDANGQTVAFEFAPVESEPLPDELRHAWAYKIPTKDFAAPLSLAFNVVRWDPAEATFQFDPGSSPQNEQTWDLDIDVPVSDRLVKVTAAKYIHPEANYRAFELTFTSDANVIGAIVEDQNHSAVAGGGETNGVPQTRGEFTSAFQLESELTGKPITVVIRSLQILVPGDWTLSWAP